MRNTLPSLTVTPTLSSHSQPPSAAAEFPPQKIPTIRLISATPSNSGLACDASSSSIHSAFEPAFTSSPLAPRSNAPTAATHKRLVPKKSKLGLLGKSKERSKNDFSDVVRRVAGTSSAGKSGYEIHVDHTDDPDLEEIVLVKKKKSRIGLDTVAWGAETEVKNGTSENILKPKASQNLLQPKGSRNILKTKSKGAENSLKPKGVENLLKPKTEESKWWSIGRGRADSSKDQKDSKRSKSPVSRARFNSLDSGIILSGSATASVPHVPYAFGTNSSQQLLVPPAHHEILSPISPFDNCNFPSHLAPPMEPQVSESGSIALRAMKSMKSMARIGSWNQLKNGEKEKLVKKERTKKKGERIEKKTMKEMKVKDRKVCMSEAGALSPVPVAEDGPVNDTEVAKPLEKKKSILGLALPSSMRFGSIRTSISSSEVGRQPALAVKRSSLNILQAVRPSSTISNSSLRPPSTASAISGKSSSSSNSSVRWDEQGLQIAKETRKNDRESKSKRLEKLDSLCSSSKSRENEGTRRTSDSGKRPLVGEIFSDAQERTRMAFPDPSHSLQSIQSTKSAVTSVEEVTIRDHGLDVETPGKRIRPRPVSDQQLLGRPLRPSAMHDDIDGLMSVLDAATNELASLINRLDLEATPCTPDGPSFKHSPISALQLSTSSNRLRYESPITLTKKKKKEADSPLRKAVTIRASAASTSSLRPYSQVPRGHKPATESISGNEHFIGQRIGPWNEPSLSVSPIKKTSTPPPTIRPTHKRTTSPPLPAFDLPPVFQPLHPPKARASEQILNKLKRSDGSGSSIESDGVSTPAVHGIADIVIPSSTFGERSSKVFSALKLSLGEDNVSINSPNPSPVFKRATLEHSRIRSSLGSKRSIGMPLAYEIKGGSGMTGIMGNGNEPEIDPEDPNADIPDELQQLIAAEARKVGEDRLSYRSSAPSPGSPPTIPLPDVSPEITVLELEPCPVFHAQVFNLNQDANHADVESALSEDDTKKSFDFTGELRKLNESGGSNRKSFVEQLENAFKSPPRIDLKYNFGVSVHDSRHLVVPPVPKLPLGTASVLANPSMTIPADCSLSDESIFHGGAMSDNEGYCSRLDIIAPSTISAEEDEIRQPSCSSQSSKPSDGQLNTNFKFGGGKPPLVDDVPAGPRKTLADIIPPTSHSSSDSVPPCVEDSSVFKSIYARATVLPCASDVAVPRQRTRLEPHSKSKRYAREISGLFQQADISHGFTQDGPRASFLGFDSFDEVRREFEFGPHRPAFYPPPGAQASRWQNKHDSIFSVASVSSYGSVIDGGNVDPFGYMAPSRPSSDDMSMSMSLSVDDTFSFMHKGRRSRVDSDASSFYFKAPPAMIGSIRRGQRARESIISVISNAPPVSLYNRNHGGNRKADSSASVNSTAFSYPMNGVNGGRPVWARHNRNDPSLDSITSDYSAMRLGRPDLGDKMLDSVFDHGMPLSAITASPTQSIDEKLDFDNRSSYDSIMDTRRSTTCEDSLFDPTGARISSSSDDDSGFFDDPQLSRGNYEPGQHFRPVSVISFNSGHDPRKDDDTMISMLGGGHVRRRSIGSVIAQSPCARVEKKERRFRSASLETPVTAEMEISPDEARVVVQKPSIVSTISSKFGDERMIKARRGVLDRQSLEESCLVADGEELGSYIHSISFVPPGSSRAKYDPCTSTSSGTDTPLLSSDASSISGGSQSSIDMGQLNVILSNATHPFTRSSRRTRARGHGHRRRISEARALRSSAYETIQEESHSTTNLALLSNKNEKVNGPLYNNVIYVVEDKDETDTEWDDERGIIAMRRYYALKDEAHETVQESRKIWLDTPFSSYAVQSFQPPAHPTGMKAMLEHSQKNYGPLPSELRPHRVRSRTYSRPSPYPTTTRTTNLSPSPHKGTFSFVNTDANKTVASMQHPLQAKSTNLMTPAPALGDLNPISPFIVDFDKPRVERPFHGPNRSHVTSSARRNTLGWTKRSVGKSSDLKENTSIGMLMTPSDSLRINRPRPRGRTTPGNARSPAPAILPMPLRI